MRAFVFRTAAVMMFVAAGLVADALLAGALPLVGAVCLLPAAVLGGLRLVHAGRVRARRSRRVAARCGRAAPAPLRVVMGSASPHGPRVA